MRSSRFVQILCLSFMLLLVSNACFGALDIFPASWRTNPQGQSPTTFQSWDFIQETNLTPENDYNQYGQSLFTPTVDSVWHFSHFAHQGVWKCVDEVEIIMAMPTPGILAGVTEEQIQIQMTFQAIGGEAPVVSMDLDGDDHQLQPEDLISVINLQDGFYHATYSFTIDDVANSESIIIKAGGDDPEAIFYLDNLIIESIFIPEPGTMALLGTGWILLSVNRKRRKSYLAGLQH